MSYEVGTKLKVIEAGIGARGCNGKTGIVVTKEEAVQTKYETGFAMYGGMCLDDEDIFFVKIDNGKVWGVNNAGKEKDGYVAMYEVLEEEAKLIRKFKAGDKVVVLEKRNEAPKGVVGVAKGYNKSKYFPNSVAVEFEKEYDFTWHCDGLVPSGNGYYIDEAYLSLQEPEQELFALDEEVKALEVVKPPTETIKDNEGNTVIFHGYETIVILNKDIYGVNGLGKPYKASTVYIPCDEHPYNKVDGFKVATLKAYMKFAKKLLKDYRK